MGLALMAMVPYLNVADDGHGELTMTFAKAFEAVLRNATIVGVPMRANKFVLRQLNADPLARCWQKLVPGLGLATAAVGSLKVLSRREFHKMVDDVYDALDDGDKAVFVIRDSDWMDRMLSSQMNAPPFNTYGSWLRDLQWGHMLAEDGRLATVGVSHARASCPPRPARSLGLTDVASLVLATALCGVRQAVERRT